MKLAMLKACIYFKIALLSEKFLQAKALSIVLKNIASQEDLL
jgi:hypothetical protein